MVVVHAVAQLVEPEPTTVLGMDETRFGRPRWLSDGEHDDGRIQWQSTDPWETWFVDITGDQALLGQADGAPAPWCTPGWPDGPRSSAMAIEVVIDPHASYAAAVHATLPEHGTRSTTST